MGTFSSQSSTISLALILDEFIFNFDICCVLRKLTTYSRLHLPQKWFTYSCLHLYQKWLLMRFILSVVLERIVIFVTKVEVVFKEFNNSLPEKYDWVLNMFWYCLCKLMLKGALLVIHSTSYNTVCSSSKWLQKKPNNNSNWLQKIGRGSSPRVSP